MKGDGSYLFWGVSLGERHRLTATKSGTAIAFFLLSRTASGHACCRIPSSSVARSSCCASLTRRAGASR